MARKLYENLQEIHYKGDPRGLTEIVRKMDIAMQELSSKTEFMKNILIKNGDFNSGVQYDKACKAIKELSIVLFEGSEEMNEMQRQIVVLQNKSFIYEDMNDRGVRPNPHNVKRIDVQVDTKQTHLTVEVVRKLIDFIKGYSDYTLQILNKLSEDRYSIGNYWVDNQFKEFSQFVDSIIRKTKGGINELNSYREHLKNRLNVIESNGAY